MALGVAVDWVRGPLGQFVGGIKAHQDKTPPKLAAALIRRPFVKIERRSILREDVEKLFTS